MKLVLHIGLTALLAVLIVANVGLAAGVFLTREPAPRPLTSARIQQASRPAVLLIQTDYTVHASVPDMVIPNARFNALVAKIQAMWNAGELSSNAQAYRAVIQLVVQDPAAYYAPGARSTGEFYFTYTGSGFFVTEDGYFVTASHVVTDSKSDLRDQAIATYKDPDNAAQDRASVAKDLLDELGLTGSGVAVTSAQQNKLEAFWQSWVAKYLTIDAFTVEYHVGTGSVRTGDNLQSNGVAASVVSIDPTDTGHDVAIMKADIARVPTLPLASDEPQIGDATYVIGYPSLDDSPDIIIPETMATGEIARRDASAGWTAYGTTAEFEPGASGGPVVDDHGNVMGIVSYSTLDANQKQIYGGGFFIPAEYIRDDLAAASVRMTSSPTNLTNTYYRALADGDLARYRVELPLLQSIAGRSAFDIYVKEDIASVETDIAGGLDRTPPDLISYVPLAAAASGAAITATMLVWLVLAAAARRPERWALPVAVGANAPQEGSQVVDSPFATQPAAAVEVTRPAIE